MDETHIAPSTHVRFSLKSLLLLFAVAGLAMATFGAYGVAIPFLFLPTFWILTASKRVELVVVLGIIFLLATLVVHRHGESWRKGTCRRNLRDIAMALRSYHDVYGQFPPLYLADAQGRPMHSWRVLILPYLPDSVASNIYQQYRFDEPWNGPRNRKLAAQLPELFSCPSADTLRASASQTTHYVAVSGPDSVWPGPAGVSVDEIGDDLKNTILLVEIAESNIQWMEPRDVTLSDALSSGNGACTVPSSGHYVERMYFFGTTYPQVGHAAMVDGSVVIFEIQPTPEQFAAMVSTNGGESINSGSSFRRSQRRFLPWLDLGRCLTYLLLVVFLSILVGSGGCRNQTEL